MEPTTVPASGHVMEDLILFSGYIYFSCGNSQTQKKKEKEKDKYPVSLLKVL